MSKTPVAAHLADFKARLEAAITAAKADGKNIVDDVEIHPREFTSLTDIEADAGFQWLVAELAKGGITLRFYSKDVVTRDYLGDPNPPRPDARAQAFWSA